MPRPVGARMLPAMDKPAAMDTFRALTWDDLCADPLLQDLPFKIELNALNQIVMSPTTSYHSRYQGRILHLLQRLLKKGEAIPELAVMTNDNVKVPDVIWASIATLKAHEDETTWSTAPEICVEVFSPTNTRKEIDFKRGLYLEAGAQEVWTCDLKGVMRFFSTAGELNRSAVCPKFPAQVKL